MSNIESKIYISQNEDNTWFASVSDGDILGIGTELTAEREYPVKVYYSRMDVMGNNLYDMDKCNNREELLETLNWIGLACYTLHGVWDFNLHNEISPELNIIFNNSFNRRVELLKLAEKEMFREAAVEEKSNIVSEKSSPYIFDHELLINDDFESINGYLWATDDLVNRLPDPEEIETANFYADYNVRTGEIKLTTSYDTPSADGEINKTMEIELTEQEKKELISLFEDYCKEYESQSCLEFVNEIRSAEDMSLIEAPKIPLNDKIASASEHLSNLTAEPSPRSKVQEPVK